MDTNKNSPYIKPVYRSDIDGLRAIAILLVIGFHAFPKWVPGGFVGVDIFFVISGFLISTIILKNLARDSFSILNFYERRICRIFPPLIIVIIFSALIGSIILFEEELQTLGRHIAASSIFSENFLLLQESGYFDATSDTKPLLHIWSLSIEEQFYIFWPLLLIICEKLKFNTLFLIIVVGGISFSTNIYLSTTHQAVANFYFPVPRFWELMVGAFLAYASIYCIDFLRNYKNIQSILGALLIIIGLILIGPDSSFPGWWALLPTLGAFFIISAGQMAWVNRFILSNKVAVGIGLISYPLYLWHWPILVYERILFGPDMNPLYKVGGIVLTFIIASLSNRYIERPIIKATSPRISLFLGTASVSLLLLGAVLFSNTASAETSKNSDDDFKAKSVQFERSRKSDGTCEKNNALKPVTEEVCISNSKAPQVLFVGDSHAMALHSAIVANEYQLSAMFIGGHECVIYPNLTYVPDFKKQWSNNCTEIAKQALSTALTTPSIKTVVIVNGFWYIFLTKPEFTHLGKRLTPKEAFVVGNGYFIDQLTKAGKNVIFVEDVPHLKYNPSDCIQRFRGIQPKVCEFTKSEFESERFDYIAVLNQLQKQNNHFKIFWTGNFFCESGICKSKIDGKWLYQDLGHISIYASQLLLKKLMGSLN